MDLDWNSIFEQRPDLKPPGYEEAVVMARLDSQLRYEQIGKKRAGSSGKVKHGKFPGMKHRQNDPLHHDALMEVKE